MTRYSIVELHGDGIATELSRSVHSVAEALPFALDFVPVDLSEDNRRKRGFALYDEAVALFGSRAPHEWSEVLSAFDASAQTG